MKEIFLILLMMILLTVTGCKDNKKDLYLPEAKNDKVYITIGGADGPTEIVVTETVTVKNTSTGEEKTLSADDSKAILDIIEESNDWTEGTADCLNDCEIKIGDRTIMYHSDCGTFNDNIGMKSISLDEKVKPYINSILETYIRLGYDITAE